MSKDNLISYRIGKDLFLQKNQIPQWLKNLILQMLLVLEVVFGELVVGVGKHYITL
jgi:hypothetical protein